MSVKDLNEAINVYEQTAVDSGTIMIVDPMYLFNAEERLSIVENSTEREEDFHNAVAEAFKAKFVPHSPLSGSELVTVMETGVGDGKFQARRQGKDIILEI